MTALEHAVPAPAGVPDDAEAHDGAAARVHDDAAARAVFVDVARRHHGRAFKRGQSCLGRNVDERPLTQVSEQLRYADRAHRQQIDVAPVVEVGWQERIHATRPRQTGLCRHQAETAAAAVL